MKLSFFVYFEGYVEDFEGFLLYFPLQRDIFFRLWHAKINQAFCQCHLVKNDETV